MANTNQQVNATISDWLGDVVALVSHVEEAMDHQLKIKDTTDTLKATIQHFHDTVRDDKKRAVAYQEQYGSTTGNPVIKTAAEVLGKAAGIIDKARNDTAAKAFRDDYTAFNHVAIAYTMLHTTAMALDDSQTQRFAEEGMRTYAGLVQRINHDMPEAVLHDLKQNDEVPVIDTNIVQGCRDTIDSVWKATTV